VCGCCSQKGVESSACVVLDLFDTTDRPWLCEDCEKSLGGASDLYFTFENDQIPMDSTSFCNFRPIFGQNKSYW
jgi:hypothetical protein